jgi:hypothetical protein
LACHGPDLTVELEMPEAMSDSRKIPAAPIPSKGVKVTGADLDPAGNRSKQVFML